MQDFPHYYKVEATAERDGDVHLTAERLDAIVSAPPVEFGGPGNHWSPETLLVAAVADCFVLSFKAIAKASKFAWITLKCDVDGTLERSEGKVRFTKFEVHATLTVPRESSEQRAHRLLEKAEESCLITNSLSGATPSLVIVSA